MLLFTLLNRSFLPVDLQHIPSVLIIRLFFLSIHARLYREVCPVTTYSRVYILVDYVGANMGYDKNTISAAARTYQVYMQLVCCERQRWPCFRSVSK